MRRLVCLVALSLVFSAPVLAEDDSYDHLVTTPDLDEAQTQKLIEQLGSADFQEREAAQKQLEQAGPELVPALQKYVESDNPEVANRVQQLIQLYAYMTKGAIVVDLLQTSRAEAIGLHRGDVVVKIGQTIVSSADFITARKETQLRTWTVWRSGKLLTFEIAPDGMVGIRTTDWDLAKGGSDQSRAFVELAKRSPDYANAYRRMRLARDKGLNDTYSLGILSLLASRTGKREAAEQYYLDYRSRFDEPCSITHDFTPDAERLSFAWAHGTFLQGLIDKPFSPENFHEMEDWFGRQMPNGPVMAQLAAKPWPSEQGASSSEIIFHDRATMGYWLSDRQYQPILDVARKSNRTMIYGADVARAVLQSKAAVLAGRPAVAMQLGGRLFQPLDPQDPTSTERPRAAPATLLNLWTIGGSAAALGDEPTLKAFFAAIDGLPDIVREPLIRSKALRSLSFPPVRSELNAFVDKHRQRSPGDPLLATAVAVTVGDPTATTATFDAVVGTQYRPGSWLDLPLQMAYDTGNLRFGRFDKLARLTTAPGNKPELKECAARVQRAIDFVKAHEKQLAGPWKAAAGLVEVVEDGSRKMTWLLRYDGQIFGIGKDGMLTQPTGLPPCPPSPVDVGFQHIQVGKETVAAVFPFARENPVAGSVANAEVVYLLDAAANRWMPLAQTHQPLDFEPLASRVRVQAFRDVAQHHPHLAGPAPRAMKQLNFRFLWFEGNLLFAIDTVAGTCRDLAQDIQKAAGVSRPVQVYHPALERKASQEERPMLLFSDCGLWQWNKKTGQLTRVVLGLPDENVVTLELSPMQFGQPPEGKRYVGVAPQNGGATYVFDYATGKATPMQALNAMGPQDWFSYGLTDERDMQSEIYATYLDRLAAP